MLRCQFDEGRLNGFRERVAAVEEGGQEGVDGVGVAGAKSPGQLVGEREVVGVAPQDAVGQAIEKRLRDGQGGTGVDGGVDGLNMVGVLRVEVGGIEEVFLQG